MNKIQNISSSSNNVDTLSKWIDMVVKHHGPSKLRPEILEFSPNIVLSYSSSYAPNALVTISNPSPIRIPMDTTFILLRMRGWAEGGLYTTSGGLLKVMPWEMSQFKFNIRDSGHNRNIFNDYVSISGMTGLSSMDSGNDLDFGGKGHYVFEPGATVESSFIGPSMLTAMAPAANSIGKVNIGIWLMGIVIG